MFLEKYTVIVHLPYINLLKVQNSNGGLFYAKKILIADIDKIFLKDLLKDIGHYMSLTLDSSNSAAKTLLAVREIIPESTFLYIILDYIEHTTQASERTMQKVLEYTRLALLYLHAHHINHYNVSIKNLFFNESGCKLGLFNIDKHIASRKLKGPIHSLYSPIEFRNTKPELDDYKALKNAIKDLEAINNTRLQGITHHVKSLSTFKSLPNSSRNSYFALPEKRSSIQHVSIFADVEVQQTAIRKLEQRRPPGIKITKEVLQEDEMSGEREELPPINRKGMEKIMRNSAVNLYFGITQTHFQEKKLVKHRISVKDLLLS